MSTTAISSLDLEALARAKRLLENPGLAARLLNLLGAPIEKGFALLPSGWSEKVRSATHAALERSLVIAIATLDDRSGRKSADLLHGLMVAATGAVGGAVGLAALPIELPLSTTLMLRSIADIARSEGEQIKDPSAKLACLEVFAFGGPHESDDAANAGYFAVRASLARVVSEAASYVAEKGAAQKGAPALVRLIAKIASRFGAVVSEKVAAEAIPVVGAVGGALINVIFNEHFQNIARGHFIVRRIERSYDPERVEAAYDDIK